MISCERHRGLAPTTGQREGCCGGCTVRCNRPSHAIAQAKQTPWPHSVHASAQRWSWADVSREGLGRVLYLSGTTDAYTVSTLGSFRHRNLTCFSTPLRTQNSWCGERGRHTLNGKWSQLMPDAQIFHSSRRGSDPSFNRAGMATDQRGRFASHPGPTLSSDSSLTKVTADSTL